MPKPVFKVALLVETSRAYGRGLLRGIANYSHNHGPWSFYIVPGDFKQVLPRMREWGGTGIIARIEDNAVAEAIRETRLPTIGLDLPSDFLSHADAGAGHISEVHPDPVGSAHLAAQHLMERGFDTFAYAGLGNRVWSQQRRAAFVNYLDSRDYACHVLDAADLEVAQDWDADQARLADWLTELPKPVGLFACNDYRGRQVLEAALAAGVKVPDELAVVGVDNDELLCDLCHPPLSSVALDAVRGGYEAASLLDRMMRGERTTPERLLIQPLWVATRASSDIIATDDAEVAQAVRYIREHVTQSISVEDILDAIPMSRRLLEIRFKKTIGRTIHEQIQHERLILAKQMLIETDMTVSQIADRSGFSSSSHLGRMLRRLHGVTPKQFRARVLSDSDQSGYTGTPTDRDGTHL